MCWAVFSEAESNRKGVRGTRAVCHHSCVTWGRVTWGRVTAQPWHQAVWHHDCVTPRLYRCPCGCPVLLCAPVPACPLAAPLPLPLSSHKSSPLCVGFVNRIKVHIHHCLADSSSSLLQTAQAESWCQAERHSGSVRPWSDAHLMRGAIRDADKEQSDCLCQFYYCAQPYIFLG